MDIHNLTPDEKKQARTQYLQIEFPYSVGLSLGEFNCNQRCRMCPMYSSIPETRIMTEQVFRKACESIGNRKVSFEISAYGETFQHPQTDLFLDLARRECPNADIIVATNGSFLNRERCERIVASGIDTLQFSLDAGSARTHKWLTGATHYDQLVRNLENLIEVRERRNAKHLKIFTHIIGIKELEHEFDAFVKRWSPLVDLAHVRTYGNWAGMVDDNGITPVEKQVIPSDRYPCAWLWYCTKIEPNGDVSKCFIHITGDKTPLGNILKQPLEEIWKSERMRKLRESHLNTDTADIEHCPSCIVWSLFPHFWEKESSENNNTRWV